LPKIGKNDIILSKEILHTDSKRIEKLVESGEIFNNAIPLTEEETDDFLDELEDPHNRYPRQ
jgi:hypothetical protein